jgi:hypothetical protein
VPEENSEPRWEKPLIHKDLLETSHCGMGDSPHPMGDIPHDFSRHNRLQRLVTFQRQAGQAASMAP